MTGSFQWSYTEGDFEGGNGTFIDIFIPDYTDRASVNWDINAITITFDAKKSIDFSRNEGIDILDFSITLFLTNPLSPTQPINIDLNRSKYEIESGGHNGGYISGTLSPNSVPLPATLWLFISAILGLAVFPKPQSTHC